MASEKESNPLGSGDGESYSQAGKPLSHFFKIVLPSTLEDKKLRIPNGFVRKFGEELSDIARVILPSGHAWEIGLTKTQDNMWFDNGWQKFVEHYSIGYWYLLVFRYRGCSNFSVLIFDMSACEIRYPGGRPTNGKKPNFGQKCSFHDKAEMEDEEPNEDLDSKISSPNSCSNASKGKSCKRPNSSSNQDLQMKKRLRSFAVQENQKLEQLSDRSKKYVKEDCIETIDLVQDAEPKKGKLNKYQMSRPCRSSFNKTEDNEKEEPLSKSEDDKNTPASSGYARAFAESNKAIQAAKMFRPKNYAFTVQLRPYHINNCFLYVPCGFAKRHMCGAAKFIKLQVLNGREWPVRKIWGDHRQLLLSKGWNQFVVENNLVEGDVCVFELVKNNGSMLKVTIFRIAEEKPLLKSEDDIKALTSTGSASTFPESSWAIHAAEMFKPENSAFKVELQPYHITKRFLFVPHGFAKRHMHDATEFIRLQVSNGREWPVRQIWSGHRRLMLSKGFHQFVVENNLVEGDVCVFELVKNNSSMLKVTIFRKAEGSRSKPLK